MKTKIIKIIILLAVSLFLSASISMAHEKKGGHHKPRGNAYGHQKWDGHHPGYQKKHYKSYHHEQRPKHHYHKRHYHKKYHDHHRSYKRYPHHNGFFFGMSIYDPNMAVIFGTKGH
jgi:hypothetical protein